MIAMIDIKEHFENFTSDMMKPAYERFQRTDEEYQEAYSFLEVNRNRFDHIMNSLSKEQRDFLQVYMNKDCFCASCSNQAMYVEGYRDCIRLLKELGVL